MYIDGASQMSQAAGLDHCKTYVGDGIGFGQFRTPCGLGDMREHLSMADLMLKGSHFGGTVPHTAAVLQRTLWEEKDLGHGTFQGA